MKLLPTRSSLIADTTSVLRTMIETGQLKDRLPGERQLAQMLHVSRDTIRGACAALETEGWLRDDGDRRARMIIPRLGIAPVQQGQLPVSILLRQPAERQPPSTLFWIDELRTELAAQGRTLQIHAPQVFDLDRPGRRLDELIHQSPAATWILYAASEPMLRWFARRRISTLVLGSVPPELTLHAVAVDFRAVGYHAAIRLIRAGHRRIALLRPRGMLVGLRELERGIMSAIKSTGSQLILWTEDRTPESVADALSAGMLKKDRPTALILTRGDQVITTYSWLAAQGIRCPSDLSLLAAVSDTWFEKLQPKMDFYYVDPRQYASLIGRTLREVLSGGETRSLIRRIVPTHIAGGTVATILE